MKPWLCMILSCWLAGPVGAVSVSHVGHDHDHGAVPKYLIAVDGLPTLASGDHAGLPNPNQGRLTMLFAHGDHIHGIGAFSYSGPVEAPTVTPTNTNNRVPETYTSKPPLTLTPGEGPLYQSKLVSKESDTEYSHLEMGLMQSLHKAKAGSEAHILFNSSNGRWMPRYQQAVIALQLVSRTAGLRIGTASAPYVLQEPGDFVILGRGNRLTLQFAPIFWTEANAPGGTYSAEFRLLDVNPNARRRIKPSGTFSFDFRVP